MALADTTLGAQSVLLALLAYSLFAVWRRYSLRAADGGMHGLDSNRLLLDFETWRSRLLARRKLKILFPKTEWESSINAGFRFGRDEILFAELTPENIRASDLVVPLKIAELIALDALRPLLADNPIPELGSSGARAADARWLLQWMLLTPDHAPKSTGTPR